MKKVLSIFLVLVMILSLSTVSMADDSVVKLTIVHTNDTHARIESGNGIMGFAKISTKVNELRAENPNLLLVDAGDTFHGQTIATLNKGESVVKVMNAMMFDVMVPGNHDFNYGQDRLLEIEAMLDFPIISGNITKEDGTPYMEGIYIKEIGGIKVGFFGLTSPETAYKTHPKNVEGLTFEDPIKAAKAMVEELKGKVDLIVCIGHIGEDESTDVTSKMIINEVDGIDLFIDGHSHTVKPTGELVKNTMLVQTGAYDANLGIVDITLTNGVVTAISAKLITLEDAANLVEDPAILEVIAEISAENKLITDVKVGTTSVLLEGTREVVRAGESNLGNLITNAMLYETGAQIAITNGGGIRASIDIGDITIGDVITVLPFGNYIVTLDVKGSDLILALENGLTDYPAAKGAFPHVAGITVTFDPEKPAMERVTSVMFNGKPLDPNAYYSVATNDFMAAGGDQYVSLGASTQTGQYAALDEALIEYLKVVNAASVGVEGRINVFVPAPVEPEVIKYTVVSGDVLWRIAQKFGTTWQKIAEINKLSNPHLIFPGNVFIITSE
ncbi:MAG TPA: multifunctional 2',3'-cyclic-nucleotide 2'-phosphodiesterase/5'-nucleotidase/3'-nucleotidase [Clostridiales bacterium UBA8960]|nr:multifunctional 2',3'-cyclic-nucleotide 2'-phosphodiesterase/5'-nucleotidase/3'-nucleotidase [Clostridiales bacterium UBA8960]